MYVYMVAIAASSGDLKSPQERGRQDEYVAIVYYLETVELRATKGSSWISCRGLLPVVDVVE